MLELLLSLPSGEATFLFAAIAGYLLCIFAPVLFSAFVVWRRRTSMQRWFLFVATVTMWTYGFTLFLYLALVIPLDLVAIYLVPPLKTQGYFEGSFSQLFLWFLDVIFSRWYLVMAAVTVLTAFFTTRYLARRWNRIAEALQVA
jgi:hypothetical protein